MNDKSILAEGVVFEDNMGITRPNDNIVGVGVSGGESHYHLDIPICSIWKTQALLLHLQKKQRH